MQQGHHETMEPIHGRAREWVPCSLVMLLPSTIPKCLCHYLFACYLLTSRACVGYAALQHCGTVKWCVVCAGYSVGMTVKLIQAFVSLALVVLSLSALAVALTALVSVAVSPFMDDPFVANFTDLYLQVASFVAAMLLGYVFAEVGSRLASDSHDGVVGE